MSDDETMASRPFKESFLFPATAPSQLPSSSPATPPQSADGDYDEKAVNTTNLPSTTSDGTETASNPIIEDVFSEYEQAAMAMVSAMGKTHRLSRQHGEKAEEEAKKIKKERDRALKEAAGLQQNLALTNIAHAEEISDIKAKQEEDLRKVREELGVTHRRHVAALKAGFLKEKDGWQNAINEPRQLREDNRALKAANKALQKQIAGGGGSKKEVKALKESEANLQARCTTLHKEFTICNAQLTAKMQQFIDLQISNGELKTAAIESEDTINKLRVRIDDLERDQMNKAELVKIGAAVRMRRMELSKSIMYGTARESLNRPVIENGNNAAHRANVRADEALFLAGVLSKESEGATFKAMYGTTLENYKGLRETSPILSEAVDLWSMVRTSIPKLSNARATTVNAQRNATMTELNGHLRRMTTEGLEESDAVRETVAQLARLTHEVLEIEKQSPGRRGP